MFYPSLSFATEIVADQYWTCFVTLNSIEKSKNCGFSIKYNFHGKCKLNRCENSSFHMGCFDRPSLMYGNNATNHTKTIFRTNTHKHYPKCVSTFTAQLASSNHVFFLSFFYWTFTKSKILGSISFCQALLLSWQKAINKFINNKAEAKRW